MITVVPVETAVTKPLESTVATDGSEEAHGLLKAGGEMLDNVVFIPSQIVNVPVIVAVVVTVRISVLEQPSIPLKMIATVPAEIPVTIPPLVTAAINGSEEIHGLIAAAAEALDNVVVKPTQTLKDPTIVGIAVTVMDFVLVQPLLFV